MKLQLNEQELSAYINEAIKQEINEATQVDFDALDKLVGGPQNQKKGNIGWNRNYISLNKQKRDLEKGTFGKSLLGRTSADAITVLRDLGYSDEQIKAGIQNGLIRKGKLSDTNGFISYDSLGKQNRRDARLKTAAGMRVSDQQNTPQQTPQEPVANNFPWSNIPDNQIAWGQNKPAKRQPARTAPTQPEVQPQETPVRKPLEKIEVPQNQLNPPTTITAPKQDIIRKEPVGNLATNTLNAMTKTSMANPSQASQYEKNVAMRRMRDNAVAATRRPNYGPTAKQDRQAIKTGYNNIKRGNNNPAI